MPHPGGALANVAVAAARGGAGASLLGGVGDDPWGRWLRQGLAQEGVDAGWVARVDTTPTPVAFVTFDAAREPSFQVYGEAIGATMEAGGRFIDEAMAEAEAVVFGSNTLVGKAERELTIRARRAGPRPRPAGALRPQPAPEPLAGHGRPRLQLCRELCDGAFLVRCTREEATLLTEQRRPGGGRRPALCALGARLGVVTLGAEGAVMRGAADGAGAAPPRWRWSRRSAPATRSWGRSRRGRGMRLGPGSGGRGAAGRRAAAGARACTGWGAQT